MYVFAIIRRIIIIFGFGIFYLTARRGGGGGGEGEGIEYALRNMNTKLYVTYIL